MSKALEAARRAIEAHPAYDCGSNGDEEMAQAAISAYLAHLVEDEAVIQTLAAEIWDGLNASGLAYEAEERRAKLSAKAALIAIKSLAGKE